MKKSLKMLPGSCLDCYAIITVEGKRVHLDISFNSDASEPIQIEEYSGCGWWMCKTCPALLNSFWSVWSEWNGLVCGSITLYDGCSEKKVRQVLNQFESIYKPCDIPTLPEGRWLVYGAIE